MKITELWFLYKRFKKNSKSMLSFGNKLLKINLN